MLRTGPTPLSAATFGAALALSLVWQPRRARAQAALEVTVSAAPNAPPLSDKVSSRTAYTEDEIARSSDTSTLQLLTRTANVTTSRGDDGFSIRGIGHDGRDSRPRDALAIVSVDGAVLPAFAATQGPLGLFDVASVEVLRGPQGIRGGPHAFAGGVYLRTRPPSFEWDARTRLSLASYQSAEAAVAGGGPIIPGKLAARLALEHQRTRGSIENLTLNDPSWAEIQQTTGRAKFLYRPTARFSALLTLTTSAFSKGQDFVDTRTSPFERQSFANDPSRETNQLTLATLELQQRVSPELQLSWTATSAFNDFSLRRDWAQTEKPDGVGLQHYDLRELSHGLVASYARASWKLWLGGYTRSQGQANTIGQEGILTARSVDASVRSSIQLPLTTFNAALFSELEYRPWRDLAISAGTRVEHVFKHGALIQRAERWQDQGAANPIVDALIKELLPAVSRDQRSSFWTMTPALGVTGKLSPALTLGASYRRSFRPGGTYYLLSRGALEPYTSEFADHYEVGAQISQLDQRLRISSNVFFLDWTNQQVESQLDDFGLDVAILNAATSTLYGGELQLDARPSENWGIFGALGYLHTRFSELFDDANQQDLSGNAFANAPPWTLGAGASYAPARGPLLALDLSYASSAFADAANRLTIDARWLLNTKLGYRFEHVNAYLFARNLLGDDYVSWRGVVGTTELARVGPPRLIGAALETTL